MEGNFQKLYEELDSMAIGYLYYQSRKNLQEISEALPKVQEFALWFLEENRIGVDEELYRELCDNLLLILEDISAAMGQGDHVLLHDAVAYGLMDYLRLFAEGGEADDVV